MTETRALTRADILPIERYLAERREHRQRITGLKKTRRLEIGPYATLFFENFDTMWYQVHEMLAIERGGEAQIVDELDAYNPLIPLGDELSATVMFEIEDPVRRARELAQLGGIEHSLSIAVDGRKIPGLPDPTRENTSADGKASSVQFIRFPFDAAAKARFKEPGASIVVGFDHPNYGHMAVMPEAVRQALAGDFT